MAIKHHRALAIVSSRRPDIQEQAILGRFRLVRTGWLDGRRTQVQRIAYTWPWLQFGRPAKSLVTRHPASIGDASEDRNTLVSGAAYLAMYNFNVDRIHIRNDAFLMIFKLRTPVI
jgi:hypothetical protein